MGSIYIRSNEEFWWTVPGLLRILLNETTFAYIHIYDIWFCYCIDIFHII